MNIVVIGSTGMLGNSLVKRFETQGHRVLSLNSKNLDIGNLNNVNRVLQKGQGWDYIVNCAAFTAVDLCETEKEKAFLLNGKAPGWLAARSNEIGVPLVHFSTDYIFSGDRRSGRYRGPY